jgi:hypothetical protein
MFIIREEHLLAFKEKTYGEVIGRITHALKQDLPQLTSKLSEEVLRKICMSGIEKALEYEFEKESNIYIFVAAMLIFGSEFDVSDEWSQKVLPNEIMSEEQKSVLLQMQIYLCMKKKLVYKD